MNFRLLPFFAALRQNGPHFSHLPIQQMDFRHSAWRIA